MKQQMIRVWALGLMLVTSQCVAQEQGKHGMDYTYAESSPTYWRGLHSTRKQDFVFRRDPHIWVTTKEAAQRAGMPLEWASDELKGVAAAAFRMEEDTKGESCGWGGDHTACKPEKRCVLELYFDRQAHKLPWDMKRQVADFDWQSVSSAYHMLPGMGWQPAENGDVSRGSLKSTNYPELGARSPFSDPQTGEELVFVREGGDSYRKVLAYDREIHSRYAFVRLADVCGRTKFLYPNGETIQLRRVQGPNVSKKSPVFYEIRLPEQWTDRIESFTDAEAKRTHEFYKKTWEELNKGEQK